MTLTLQPVTTHNTMSEPAKPPVGESPKVAHDYGSNEPPKMSAGEPKKHAIDMGSKEPKEHAIDIGAKEPPKRPVYKR